MGADEQVSDTEIVERVIRAVGELDIASARHWLADDLVLELPFRSGGHPRTLVGDDAHAFMALLPKIFDRMDFTRVEVHGPTPSGVIVAEYASDGMTKAGAPYPNSYAAFFEVENGIVVRWREYFNPDVIVAAGLG
jgi:ketosteroid isomerase-like protein